jgi:hypothetical protein
MSVTLVSMFLDAFWLCMKPHKHDVSSSLFGNWHPCNNFEQPDNLIIKGGEIWTVCWEREVSFQFLNHFTGCCCHMRLKCYDVKWHMLTMNSRYHVFFKTGQSPIPNHHNTSEGAQYYFKTLSKLQKNTISNFLVLGSGMYFCYILWTLLAS